MSSASFSILFAKDRSGAVHIAPMTWQKAKTRTMNRMLAWTTIYTADLTKFSAISLCSLQQVHQVRQTPYIESINSASKPFEKPHGIRIVIPMAWDDLQSMRSISFQASSEAFLDSCLAT